jgi:hypothetical protein
MAAADDLPNTPTLDQAISSGWMQFSVVSGRIVVAGSRIGNYSTTSSSNGRKEQLSVRVRRGQFAVSYQLDGTDEDLSFELLDGKQLLVRRVPGDESDLTAVKFQQTPGEPLLLTLGTGPEAEVLEAATLWHLLLAHGEACRQHLLPLLELLRPDWKLAETAHQIEEALLRAAADSEAPDREQWQALVDQLADERFARRQAADRRLRALGPQVAAFLERLRPDELDAEQQFRIRRIIRALSDQDGDDSVSQVVAWLSADYAVWLVLMQRESQSVRRLAARQLEVLLGQSVAFDPDADEATRAKQIAELRARLQGGF